MTICRLLAAARGGLPRADQALGEGGDDADLAHQAEDRLSCRQNGNRNAEDCGWVKDAAPVEGAEAGHHRLLPRRRVDLRGPMSNVRAPCAACIHLCLRRSRVWVNRPPVVIARLCCPTC